jgi:hypothetical protein
MRLTVTIPQPCPESWDAMTPTSTGRHCAACQKTVVDFSLMSDGEILALLQKSSTGLCGRFDAGQLARPLRPVAVAASRRWQTWAATLATVLGLRELLPATAQAQLVPTEQTARKPFELKRNKLRLPVPEKAGSIRGQVLDSATQQALPGVAVFFKGQTSATTSTDANGHFLLKLPAGRQRNTPQLLVFQMLGYQQQETSVLLAEMATAQLDVRLTTDTSAGAVEVTAAPVARIRRELIMGGAVGIRVMERPAPKANRSFYQWLARPFRRG